MKIDSILILEDTADTLRWLFDLVTSIYPAARVITATNLSEAKVAVRQDTFDLAIVDLGLPDGSGIDLIDLVREKEQPTYIVVATIYDDDKHLFAALRAGANGYILKDDDRNSIGAYLSGIEHNQAPISPRSMDQVLGHFHQQGDARRDSALTKREEDVLVLIAKGFSAADSASMLSITENTVKGYIKEIYAKLGVNSRAEATAYAIKRNLIDL
tara:strand:+ start:6470 stop:7111 length:642 start_codon:yes stop_codon:yes gene_type:complete